MQGSQRLSAISKLHGQPLEEFRMSRACAHMSKVVGGIDESASKMLLPDPVDDRTPCQWIVRAS